MKKFIIKIIFFALPLSVFVIEVFLPLNTFTYRPWEALHYYSKKGVAFPFYPNQNLLMYSTGDLCYYTKNAVIKKEDWITDKLGYRNNKFIKNPEIVLIGDSFITGSSLPQDSTLTNLLKNKLNTKVYNLAPASFNDFICVNNNIIEKPKLVIFSCVERSIPVAIKKINNNNIAKSSIFRDKILRLYSLKYITARIKGTHGAGVAGKIDSTMFFLNGVNQKYHFNKINKIVKTLTSYKNYCDSIGVNFIFLPIPNKETVYFDKLPLNKQPNFLLKLDSLLKINNVKTINTLNIINNYRKSNKKNIYHLDDTHWNSSGVELIGNNIIKTISKNTQ